MAKYGSADVKLSIKDGVDGAGDYQEISEDTLEFSGLEIEALTEEAHGFGEDWVRHAATGLKKGSDITLKCFYDDTASTGTLALIKREGSVTDLKIEWGGTETTEVPVLIQKVSRKPVRGELTKLEATLLVSGEPVDNPTP